MKILKYALLLILLSSMLFSCGVETSAPSVGSSEAPPSSFVTTAEATETEKETETTAKETETTENHTETTEKETETEKPEGRGTLDLLVLKKEDNPAIANDLEFEIDEAAREARLSLDFTRFADLYTLQNAVLTAEFTGLSVSFSSTDKNGKTDLTEGVICTVTDETGEKEYSVAVDRTVYSLPIVSITLDGGIDVDSIDREEVSDMRFSLDCSFIEGAETVPEIEGTIRGRGNSTWKWDKKPYKIKLDIKVGVLGMEKNRDWILLANHADKTLLRNTVAYEMARELDGLTWTPHSYPVDLFINGEYRGVYSIGEHLEIANGRLELEENSADTDTDYLIEIGGMAPTGDVNGVHYFHTGSLLVRFATFKSPDFEAITDEQKTYIRGYFRSAETAIVSGEGYEAYIDVDSFVDWIILHELTNNLDSCFRRSCFLIKEKGGLLKMGPVWDFDLAFGNLYKDNKYYDDWATVGEDDKDAYVKENWCNHLLEDPEFAERLALRWEEKGEILVNRAMETIDRYSALLSAGSEEQNFRVWPVHGVRVGPQPSWCYREDTYEKQIDYLKSFIISRAKWLDENVKDLPIK